MPRRRLLYGHWPEFQPWPELQPQQPKLVVALEPEVIDPQEQSPLYDGTIPPDVRKKIFESAMAEYVDPGALYPTNTDYTRPNFFGKKVVCINPLLMCKKSYLETCHLPPINKTHTFWHNAGPPGQRYGGDERGYFSRFQPAQLALVKEVHLFTQQFWLEGSFPSLCRFVVLQGIERMKITLRRGDWWWNERNAQLAITPHRHGVNDVQNMRGDWRREKMGEVVTWDPSCWGSAFSFLEGLKELEMEFETYDYKEKELDEIVQHAALWKFPMGDGKVLSSDGAIRRSSWRGPPCGWGQCPKRIDRGHAPDCNFCKVMRALRKEGKGPMLTLRSLRWKLTDSKLTNSVVACV